MTPNYSGRRAGDGGLSERLPSQQQQLERRRRHPRRDTSPSLSKSSLRREAATGGERRQAARRRHHEGTRPRTGREQTSSSSGRSSRSPHYDPHRLMPGGGGDRRGVGEGDTLPNDHGYHRNSLARLYTRYHRSFLAQLYWRYPRSVHAALAAGATGALLGGAASYAHVDVRDHAQKAAGAVRDYAKRQSRELANSDLAHYIASTFRRPRSSDVFPTSDWEHVPCRSRICLDALAP